MGARVDLTRFVVEDVERWHTEDGSDPVGTWPCGVCGVAHRAARSWNIVLQSPLGGATSLIACGRCARRARERIG